MPSTSGIPLEEENDHRFETKDQTRTREKDSPSVSFKNFSLPDRTMV
jgi:hypothetical protein